jgi:hypothetical protein
MRQKKAVGRERHTDETEEGCRERETQMRQKKAVGRERHR